MKNATRSFLDPIRRHLSAIAIALGILSLGAAGSVAIYVDVENTKKVMADCTPTKMVIREDAMIRRVYDCSNANLETFFD